MLIFFSIFSLLLGLFCAHCNLTGWCVNITRNTGPTLLDDFVAWRHRLDGGVLSETGEDVEPAASLYAPLRPHFTLDHLCKSLSAPVEVMEWDQYWDVDPRAKRQGRHSPQPTCFDMEWDE